MVFDNHCVNVIGEVAIAMGNYYFTSCADGSKTKVEYTFGYSKNSDGKEGVSKKSGVLLLGASGDPWAYENVKRGFCFNGYVVIHSETPHEDPKNYELFSWLL